MKKYIIPIIIGLLSLYACSEDPELMQDPEADKTEAPAETDAPEEAEEPEIPEIPAGPSLTANSHEIKELLHDFEMKYIQGICDNCKDEFKNDNFVASPLSAALTMSMIANALNEEEALQMVNMLGIADLPSLNDACRDIIEYVLKKKFTEQVELSNAFWYNQLYDIDPDYSRLLQDTFSAQCSPLDFSSTSAVDIINAWACDKTNGLIPSIIDEILPDELGIWTNALYYSADWTYKFDPQLTEESIFHGTQGDCAAQMMHNPELRTEGCETDEFVYLSVSLIGNCGFFLFMPKGDINSFKITPEIWDEVAANKENWKLDLKMPRFSVESSLNLTSMFQALGLPSITAIPALKGIPDGFKPIKIQQNSSIKLDEDGIRMASVTMTDIVGAAPIVYIPKTVIVDRPFFYVVKHWDNNSILMAGRICNI